MYLTLLGLAVLSAAGYAASVRIHPFRRCRWCAGTGKHFGSIYVRAHRPCRHCGGVGRTLRFGGRSGKASGPAR
jgi:formamidopyrimidine-DNA glycosylase